MPPIKAIVLAISCLYACTAFGTTAAVVLQKTLNDFPGREVLMLTVEYEPGESSPLHRHNAHTFVYVLEGAIVMQVTGGEKVTLDAGKTFYETPEDVHLVSMNASSTDTAKFLVFFIKREGAPPTVAVDRP